LPADLPDTAPDQCDVADGLTSAAMLQTAAYRHSHLRLCLRLTARGAGETRVPAGKVYTAKDIAEDPHYRARDMILSQHTRDGDDIEVPGIVPKLSLTPGTVRSSAPHVGDDTDAVLAEAGLTAQQIALLRSKGVIQ